MDIRSLPYMDTLISKAMVGTDYAAVAGKQLAKHWANSLPDELQQAIVAIENQAASPEQAFLEVSMMLISLARTTDGTFVPSFSCEQMESYQQIYQARLQQQSRLEQQGRQAAASRKSKRLRKGAQNGSGGEASAAVPESALAAPAAPAAPAAAASVAASAQAPQPTPDSTAHGAGAVVSAPTNAVVDPQHQAQLNQLFKKVQQFQGPVPLLAVQGSHLPPFPPAVSELFEIAVLDESSLLRFYLCSKLSPYAMQVRQDLLIFLEDWYKDSATGGVVRRYDKRSVLGLRLHQISFSDFMLQEHLYKLGGAAFRYLLPYVAKGFNTALAEQQLKNSMLNLDDIAFDYAAIFSRASPKESLGVFIKLRWTAPALARELLVKKLKRCSDPELGMSLIEAMLINLSYDDEPCLNELRRKDKDWYCCSTSCQVLAFLPKSQFVQACGQECAKYLKFNGKSWESQDVSFEPESKELLESLGVHRRDAVLATNLRNKAALKVLLKGASWSSLKAMAQTEDDALAIERWSRFDTDMQNTTGAVYGIAQIVGSRIAAEQDLKAADAFLNNSRMMQAGADIIGPLLMLFDVDQRLQYLKQNPFKFRFFDSSWMVERGSNPLEFKPVDDRWAHVLLEAHLDNLAIIVEDQNEQDLSTFTMYLSEECITWCENRYLDLQRESTELAEKLYKLELRSLKNNHQALSLNSLKKRLHGLNQSKSLLNNILERLKCRYEIDHVIARELGEPVSKTQVSETQVS